MPLKLLISKKVVLDFWHRENIQCEEYLGQSFDRVSDVCRRIIFGRNNNNNKPHNNVNNNMTTPTNLLHAFDKQYEVYKMYSLQCKREKAVLFKQR